MDGVVDSKRFGPAAPNSVTEVPLSEPLSSLTLPFAEIGAPPAIPLKLVLLPLRSSTSSRHLSIRSLDGWLALLSLRLERATTSPRWSPCTTPPAPVAGARPNDLTLDGPVR